MSKRQKPEWEDNFIRLLGQTCNVSLSAKGAGITRSQAYQYRGQSVEFAKRWKEAKSEAIELLEAKAWQRAQNTSDTLMIFLLKAHKPSKYQDRVRVLHEFNNKEIEQLKQIKAQLDKYGTPASQLFQDLLDELASQDAGHPTDSTPTSTTRPTE
jgi:hypothetical protein